MRLVTATSTAATGTAAAIAGASFAFATVRERRGRQRAERFAAAAIESLLRAIDANDKQTGAHVRRVAAYSMILADAMGLDAPSRRTLELTALFHDVGKIHRALVDIVHEPRRLTRAEREAIHTHPARGADVVAPLGDFHPALAEGVLAHHERWDGSGYPRGLRGRRIPLLARIVAIVDTFDAVSYSRRYRGARSSDEAARIILEGRGSQFDPELVDLFTMPPVLEDMTRAHETFARRGISIPHRERGEQERPPKVRIRWRTRTGSPHAVQRQLARTR
jgi:HD-GYP domain-containing protein (c-di-GMP phosphodiesterase class II)